LVKRGAKVIISGRKLPQLSETQKLATEHIVKESTVKPDDIVKIISFPFENQTPPSLRGWCNKAWDWQGRIDILFNNAGGGSRGFLTTPETDHQVLEVTSTVPIFLMKWMINQHGLSKSSYMDHKDADCVIVNTASVISRLTGPGRVAYGAAKSAVLHAAECLNVELDMLQIKNTRIISCLPGPTDTNFSLNCILDDGSTNNTRDSYLANGMTSNRCAVLMLRAASRGIRESWISQQSLLDMMYFTYYTPYCMSMMQWIMLTVPYFRRAMMVVADKEGAVELTKDKSL